MIKKIGPIFIPNAQKGISATPVTVAENLQKTIEDSDKLMKSLEDKARSGMIFIGNPFEKEACAIKEIYEAAEPKGFILEDDFESFFDEPTDFEDFSDFLKHGWKFVKGKAVNDNGNFFTGTVKANTKAGQIYELRYYDGLLQESQRFPKGSDVSDWVREYTYSPSGKLLEVETSLKTSENKSEKIGGATISHYKPQSLTVLDDDKVESYVYDFSKTVEGKRRALLTDEDIEEATNEIMAKVFASNKEMAQYQSVSPTIVVADLKDYGFDLYGGCYIPEKNILAINAPVYRAGACELENIIAHELVHFKESALRSRLTEAQRRTTVIDYLVNKTINGENDKVFVHQDGTKIKTMTPPKMTPKMREDFSKLAVENLYYDGTLYGSDIDEIIRVFLKKNPTYISQYKDFTEALSDLQTYCASHHNRYMLYSKGTRSNIDTSHLPPLTPEEERLAQKSTVEFCDTIEGNLVLKGNIESLSDGVVNQYMYSPEEITAETSSLKFAIEELEQKRKALEAKGELTPQFRAYFQDAINKLKASLDLRTTGAKWYADYSEALKNPSDKALQELTESEKKEVEKIQDKMAQGATSFMTSLVYRKK